MVNRSGVNKLSDELLGTIFIYFRQIVQGKPTRNDMPKLRRALRWTRIMLVCRLWRDVALVTAALWTVIDIPRARDKPKSSIHKKIPTITAKMQDNALKWFNLILPRSAKMHLELVFTRPEYGSAALPILATESRRIRSLTFPDSNTPQLTNAVLSVLQLDLPAVMELDMLYEGNSPLRYSASRPESLSERRAEITPERYPSLRIMRLSNLTLCKTSMSVLPQLERLDLRFCSFDVYPASLDNLLDVLAGCPNLVEIQLHFVLSMLTDGAPPPYARTIPLNNLQKLVLRDVPLLTRRFLSHISIPAATTLGIFGTVDDLPPVFDVYSTLIAMVPLPDFHHLPIFNSLTEGTVYSGEESAHLKVSSPTAKVSLMILHDHYQHSDLPSCLTALRTLCAESPLTKLDINGYFDEVEGTLPWRELFGVFGSLEILKLTGKGSILCMVCALGQTPARTGTDTDAEVDNTPACPHLRVLEATNVYWERGLAEALTGVLRLRAASGLRKLNILKMGIQFRDDEDMDEGIKTMDRYRDIISSHVGYFDWELDPYPM